jgi:protein pelota
MKVLESAIQSKNGCGFVRLQPEEEEDIYHLYNLLNKGDRIEALTMRNVVKESKSGARDRQRVLTKVEIEVEKIEFDAEQCSLRIKGTNVKENDFLKLGQYHTLELELNRPCRISKDRWDSIHMELIADISDPASKSEVAAIVIGEGLAHVCLLKASLTKTCARLERQLPKKRGTQGTQAYDAAVQKFFGDIYEAVKRHINFDIVKVVLVGSPGMT